MMREKWIKQYGHLLDKEGAFLKAIDKITHAQRYYERQETQFCSPDIAYGMSAILKTLPELNAIKWGGYDGAERVRFLIAPDFEELNQSDFGIQALEYQFPSKFHSVAHRDVLGALMGLGIQRERTGDILIGDTSFVMILDSDLCDYVLMSLESVGRAPVKGTKIELSEITEMIRPIKLKSDTVKSLRLDAVVASFYNLSRGDAQKLVATEKVKVNYRLTVSNAYEVDVEDLISVRGYGRFSIHAIEGTTKKERIRIVFSSSEN